MRGPENYGNIAKIEAVLFKVGKPFSFILFKAHISMYTICVYSQVSPLVFRGSPPAFRLVFAPPNRPKPALHLRDTV